MAAVYLAANSGCAAGGAATIREYDKVFTTYPYSDPDPIPAISRFYPYFRYDGFTDLPVQKKWKVVELSNDYLQILILPEIGGKIWATIEKSTGRSFIYFNHVVKFRDVSMRGPWTSGGMEPNYGIMGHTPNCFTPVDYLVRNNPDRSVSCFIGVLDLLTRTAWRLEINLPANQAWFFTRSFWHNSSGLDQPYYTWMNVGIKAAGNLQFINPGTKYLGHDGKVFAWPINPENRRDISWYDNNDFGSYKSYHVLGQVAEFFGAYWHDEDFGMARCSAYGDKPGRKIWIWGLSREGMIWEKLLTDSDGQYVEVQSGRLFNQANESSTSTPFKHKDFPPYATDTWTEYWQPVKGTKGFVTASPWGAVNVSRQGTQLSIRISPSRPLRDTLQVLDGPHLLWEEIVNLLPMQPLERIVTIPAEIKALEVRLGGDKLVYVSEPHDISSRPLESPGDFDWQSTYGLYVKGTEDARQRSYAKAAQQFHACLDKDPNFAPALEAMASLANRRADYAGALVLARHALSIDTYDPAANYQFGLASAALGHAVDAKDAFGIAALSLSWRTASSVELANQFLRERRFGRALSSAEESLNSNRLNIDAIQLRACIYRLQGRTAAAQSTLQELLELDPLNHFGRFEKYLLKKAAAAEVIGLIRNELPQETYLELAAWYRSVGLDEDARKLLELAPPTAEVLYWLAYLRRNPSLLARAEAASPAFVFPFRPESIAVFEWADKQRAAWQPKYFLALIRWSQGETDEARRLLKSCGEQADFAPFYAARAQAAQETAQADLQMAARLDPRQWRYGAMLARHHLNKGERAAALAVAADYAKRFRTNDVLALLYAKTLIVAARYREAVELLSSLSLLPCEGSTEAHSLFRQAHLMLAAEKLQAGKPEEALQFVHTAREWPERLGAGKPYPEELDERLEDWLEYRCLLRSSREDEARQALERIVAFSPGSRQRDIGQLIGALALARAGRVGEGEQSLKAWLSEEPSNDLARWGLELLAGHTALLPAEVQDLEARAIEASLE